MPDLAPIHHVKIPVSDVRASTEWYTRVLGLTVAIEFVENRELRGVALGAPDGGTQIALRHDPERAAGLRGFDLVALGVPTREGAHAWAEHLTALDQKHGGLVTGHNGGTVLVGLHDPDGIEMRPRAHRTDVRGRPHGRVRGPAAPPRHRPGAGACALVRLRVRAATRARPSGAGQRARPGRTATDRPAAAAIERWSPPRSGLPWARRWSPPPRVICPPPSTRS